MPKRRPLCGASSGVALATPLVAAGSLTGSTSGSPASGGAPTSCPADGGHASRRPTLWGDAR
eukprot:5326018-Alexandrium_andersonii.AAC.1